MTARTEFFCDYCNPSRQRRDEGDELNTGYVVTEETGFPLGWWEGGGRHACPECIMHREGVMEDIRAHRREAIGLPNDTTPSEPGEWPAVTSPFGGEGG